MKRRRRLTSPGRVRVNPDKNECPCVVPRFIALPKKLRLVAVDPARSATVNLSGSIDLRSPLQEFRAANARGHPVRLLAQIDRLLRETVLERG